MSKRFDRLDPKLREFIRKQALFIVASAPHQGRVNTSPKGMNTLRIIDDRTVAYLDLTGSGAETSAHVLENGRLTLMFMSFDAQPLILRLYGRGEIIRPDNPNWPEWHEHFETIPGERQIILLHIEMVQTSCGFGVPMYDYRGERETLREWAQKKGDEGLREYRLRKNRVSLDGLDTGLAEEAEETEDPGRL